MLKVNSWLRNHQIWNRDGYLKKIFVVFKVTELWNIVSLVISDCNVNFVVLQDARMSNVCLDRKPKHKKGSRFWKWRWYKRHKTNEGKIVLAHNTANSNRENLGQQPPVGDWSCKWKLTKIVEVQTIVFLILVQRLNFLIMV